MYNQRFKPAVRRDLILSAAVEVAQRPGGWIGLTRIGIATHADCSEALVSRYLGDMKKVRKSIMRVAMKYQINEIIEQSIAAHDGYAPNQEK